MQQLLPRVGPVHPSCLVELDADRLQARQEDHHVEAEVHPHVDEGKKDECEPHVGEPAHVRQPEVAEEDRQRPVHGEQVHEHGGDGHRGGDVGNEVDGTVRGARPAHAVHRNRGQKSEHGLNGNDEHDEGEGDADRRAKDGVGKKLAVVGQPDELSLRIVEDVDALEAQDERRDDGREEPGRQEEQGRGQEKIRCRCFRAPSGVRLHPRRQ